VNFNAQLGPPKGGVKADVSHPFIALSTPIHDDRIDTTAGDQLIGGAHVGGWKAEFPPFLIALNYGSRNRIETPKEEGRFVDAALLHPLANDRAADDAPLDGDRFDDVHMKPVAIAQFLQKRDRPLPPLAECKVIPHIDLSNADCPHQHLLDKRHGSQVREFRGEGQADDHIEFAGLHKRQFLRRGGDQRRAVLGRQDFQGMRIERQDDRRAADLARALAQSAKDLLMPEVNAVEIPDRHDRRRERFRKRAQRGDHIHSEEPYQSQGIRCSREIHLTIRPIAMQEKTPRCGGIRGLKKCGPVKSVDKALTPVICPAPTALVGDEQGAVHLVGGWMVSRDASLPAIGLVIMVIVFNGRSLVQAANRQQASSAKQTVQRVMSLSAQAARPSETLPLSLMESIALALGRNFDIIIEGFNPKIRATDVINEQAEFDPITSAGFSYSGGKEHLDDAPIRWPPDRTAKVRISTPVVGVEQRLQSGTRLGLQVSQQHINSNETASTSRFIEPSDELRTTLTLVQPVLRDFGFDANRARIRIAETNQEISESSLKERVIRVVTIVQELYWELVFRIQELEVRRLSLKLAQDLLAQTRVQVAVGTQPQLSILEGEAGVAAREEAVILAENNVRNVQDRLKELLSFFEDRQRGGLEIVPTDAPQFTIEAIDLEKALEAAFEHRPDYRQVKLEIESRALNERFTRNQLLPSLDLEGRVGLNGIDDNFGDTLNHFTSGNWVQYRVGFAFRYPLGNQAAKSRFTRARLEVEQAKAVLERTEQRILVEVREAVRNVETNIKRVSVTRGARELAQKKLEAEEKKLTVGLSSVREILRFQDDLSLEQSREIRALTDYNVSLANLDRAKGTTLERLNIVVGDR
jgi:outer membrane protein TolC